MRKVTGLFLLVGAVIAPLSLARASTEVMHFKANNTFATAVSNAPDGTSIGVFVSREKGNKGGPVDTIFAIISNSNTGSFAFIGGTLPKGAFHVDAHSASVSVAVSDIAVTAEAGDIPADGVINVDWEATDTTRTSGSTKFEFGNVKVNFVGTASDSPCNLTGSVLGSAMTGAVGDLNILHEGTIIVTKD